MPVNKKADISCKTLRRVSERESNPHPFSVSGKCRELNFSRSPEI